MRRLTIIWLFLFFLFPYDADAQEMIRGIVITEGTMEPLAGVTVWIPGERRGTTTDAEGTFTLERGSDPDPLLRIQGLGYVTTEIRLRNAVKENGRLRISVKEAPLRMNETVVTAGRREQSLSTVPVSISSVNARDLTERISVTLEEPLRYVSGVNIMDDQINIRGSSGYSRGVGSRVLLLFDGVPLLTGDTGEIIWEMIPVDQIDRVEVVKGAGSALYGSSALGGVINVIPSRIPEGIHAGLRLSGAMYERPLYEEWQWSGKARTLTQGSVLLSKGTPAWGTVFSFSRWMDESHRKNDVTHRYTFYNRSRFDLSSSWTLSFAGHYVHRLGGNFFWWKSLRSPLQPPDEYASRRVFSDRGFLGISLRGIHSADMTSLFRLQYYSNVWSDEDVDVVTTDSRSTRIFSEVQVTLELTPRHHVVAGATAYLDNVRSNIFGAHPGIGAAVFVQDEYGVLPGLDLSAGARFDWQQVSGLPSGSQIDPRLGVAYRISGNLTLRSSVGTGFRYPSIGELYTAITTGFGGVNVVPNPALRPERSVSYEAGLLYQYANDGSIDMAVFRSDYDELIEASVDAQQLVIRFENLKKARVQGVELSGEQELLDHLLTVRAGYTYVDPSDVRTGRTLRFRPRHVGVVGLDVRMSSMTMTTEFRFVSRIEEIDENLVNVAEMRDGAQRTAIHVLNLRGSWAVPSLPVPLRIGFEVRNLTNHQYVELLANLAPPRTYMLTIETLL